MTSPVPSLGANVPYQLSPDDCTTIDRQHPMTPPFAPDARNPVAAGDVLPAVVTRVNADGSVNLKVFLDGAGEYWATSRVEGAGPGTWAWLA